MNEWSDGKRREREKENVAETNNAVIYNQSTIVFDNYNCDENEKIKRRKKIAIICCTTPTTIALVSWAKQ